MLSKVSTFWLLLAHIGLAFTSTEQSATPSNYSLWMASSIMSRGQGILTGQGDVSEQLQTGFTQKAFEAIVHQYPHHPIATQVMDYIRKSVDSIVPVLSNSSRDTTYPLDRLSNGNALVELGLALEDVEYQEAARALRNSIDLQPRNAVGGYWFYVYPEWSYLDGMYSMVPFYALYTNKLDDGNSSAYEDIIYQLDLLWDHCRQPSGLLVHGYDYSRTAVWANKVTGASPHVWSRSLGWYMMALVDTMEILSSAPQPHGWTSLHTKLVSLSKAIMEAVDPVSGAWWQILDQPGRLGNYIESSGSSMLVFALLKASRLRYITGGEEIARRGYQYIVEKFVVPNSNGTLDFNGTVAVCTLNSTASFDYYVSQPVLYNSVLGTQAFVLASLEYELLGP